MKISIALCTFNGERYLDEQLASIAAQTRLPDEMVICDDGSTDNTLSIVELFAKKAAFAVRIVQNKQNLGVIANFQQAVGLCHGELTALADQDDVWLPDKLANAEQVILSSHQPEKILYCTRLIYVGQTLKTLGFSPIPDHTDFSNAVVENSATGCSVVFSNDIKKKFLQARSVDMVMHDWWLYLVATAFGNVIYDLRPSVLYRQHVSNVAGWQPRSKKLWRRLNSLRQRLKTGSSGMDSLNQAARFIEAYEDLSFDKVALVNSLIKLRQQNIIKRLLYALKPDVARNNALENIGLRIMLFMGWH
jgi:glycosyltransferase involved in cell wall biosynthesis